MCKVKHGEWMTPAVAGSFVVVSTLSLCCSISNYKDFLLLRTEEIKRFKWHTRTDVCQRLCCDVMRFSVERPGCLCFVHARTQLVCANESTGRCACSMQACEEDSVPVCVCVCQHLYVHVYVCSALETTKWMKMFYCNHETNFPAVHVWVGILRWRKLNGICQKTQGVAVCTALGLTCFLLWFSEMYI